MDGGRRRTEIFDCRRESWMDFKEIKLEREDSIQILTLNRPEQRNALSWNMRLEMIEALENISRDEGIRALIITGAGDKSFCSGGNIIDMRGITPTRGRWRMGVTNKVTTLIWEMEKPVIAAVNGWVVGGACGIVFACDVIVASEKARFMLPFMRLGLVPDMGTMFFLPRLIGLPRAKELMFTTRILEMKEAERIGIVNCVIPQEILMAKAMELARAMVKYPRSALGMTKAIVNKSTHLDLQGLLELEGQAQDILFQTDDFKEGKKAFLEKREPVFK